MVEFLVIVIINIYIDLLFINNNSNILPLLVVHMYMHVYNGL